MCLCKTSKQIESKLELLLVPLKKENRRIGTERDKLRVLLCTSLEWFDGARNNPETGLATAEIW
jgi:DTW domain-containing protein YfiP